MGVGAFGLKVIVSDMTPFNYDMITNPIHRGRLSRAFERQCRRHHRTLHPERRTTQRLGIQDGIHDRPYPVNVLHLWVHPLPEKLHPPSQLPIPREKDNKERLRVEMAHLLRGLWPEREQQGL